MPANTTTATPDEEPEDANVVDVDGEEVPAETEGGPKSTTAALVVANVPGPLMRPVATRDETVQAFREYQALRNDLLTPADFQRAGKKEFVVKAGWRKLAVAMGVSDELRDRDYLRDDKGRIIRAEVVVRAIAPNGRYADGLGFCDFRERCCPTAYGDVCGDKRSSHKHCKSDCDGFNHFSKSQHDIPATAHTRAKNRAFSDLFGFGEVSAEEVTDKGENTYNNPADGADVERLVVTMNAIPNEQDRARIKHKFLDNFGQPNAMVAGQIDRANNFLKACGYDPAETKMSDAASQAEPVAPKPPERDSQDAPRDPEVAASTAPEGNSGSDAPEGGGNGTVRQSQTPTVPAPTPAEPAPPSTAHQRQRIGMRVAELVKAGFLIDGDKPEIVGALTADRTSTTTEITSTEAEQMLAVLRLIESQDLAMCDNPEIAGVRAVGAVTPKGEQFITQVLGAA